MKRCALLLLTAACGSGGPEILRVDIPIERQHQSVVMATVTEGKLTVQASAIGSDRTVDPLQLPYVRSEDIEITALLYESDLDSLALPSGPLPEATDETLARPLPDAQQIRQTIIRAEADTGWSPLDDLPQDLARFRLPDDDPCNLFEARVISLGTAPEPALVLAMDDTWSLVTTNARLLPGTEAPAFFTDGSLVVPQMLPTSIFSGYREDGGRIWLGGEGGAIYTATFTADPEPQITLTFSSTVSSREDVIDLVGPASGMPDQRFAMTTNREDTQWGAFEWFDGTDWTVPGLRRNTPHDATWVEPGYGLFASFFRDGEVFGARDGMEVSINVDSVVLGNVVLIENMPGFGMVAATTGAEVHRELADGTWVRLVSNGSQRIMGIHAYEDSIVYLPGNDLARWVPDRECENVTYGDPELEVVRKMTVVGGRHVVVPLKKAGRSEAEEGEQFVAWFQRLD